MDEEDLVKVLQSCIHCGNGISKRSLNLLSSTLHYYSQANPTLLMKIICNTFCDFDSPIIPTRILIYVSQIIEPLPQQYFLPIVHHVINFVKSSHPQAVIGSIYNAVFILPQSALVTSKATEIASILNSLMQDMLHQPETFQILSTAASVFMKKWANSVSEPELFILPLLEYLKGASLFSLNYPTLSVLCQAVNYGIFALLGDFNLKHLKNVIEDVSHDRPTPLDKCTAVANLSFRHFASSFILDSLPAFYQLVASFLFSLPSESYSDAASNFHILKEYIINPPSFEDSIGRPAYFMMLTAALKVMEKYIRPKELRMFFRALLKNPDTSDTLTRRAIRSCFAGLMTCLKRQQKILQLANEWFTRISSLPIKSNFRQDSLPQLIPYVTFRLISIDFFKDTLSLCDTLSSFGLRCVAEVYKAFKIPIEYTYLLLKKLESVPQNSRIGMISTIIKNAGPPALNILINHSLIIFQKLSSHPLLYFTQIPPSEEAASSKVIQDEKDISNRLINQWKDGNNRTDKNKLLMIILALFSIESASKAPSINDLPKWKLDLIKFGLHSFDFEARVNAIKLLSIDNRKPYSTDELKLLNESVMRVFIYCEARYEKTLEGIFDQILQRLQTNKVEDFNHFLTHMVTKLLTLLQKNHLNFRKAFALNSLLTIWRYRPLFMLSETLITRLVYGLYESSPPVRELTFRVLFHILSTAKEPRDLAIISAIFPKTPPPAMLIGPQISKKIIHQMFSTISNTNSQNGVENEREDNDNDVDYTISISVKPGQPSVITKDQSKIRNIDPTKQSFISKLDIIPQSSSYYSLEDSIFDDSENEMKRSGSQFFETNHKKSKPKKQTVTLVEKLIVKTRQSKKFKESDGAARLIALSNSSNEIFAGMWAEFLKERECCSIPKHFPLSVILHILESNPPPLNPTYVSRKMIPPLMNLIRESLECLGVEITPDSIPSFYIFSTPESQVQSDSNLYWLATRTALNIISLLMNLDFNSIPALVIKKIGRIILEFLIECRAPAAVAQAHLTFQVLCGRCFMREETKKYPLKWAELLIRAAGSFSEADHQCKGFSQTALALLHSEPSHLFGSQRPLYSKFMKASLHFLSSPCSEAEKLSGIILIGAIAGDAQTQPNYEPYAKTTLMALLKAAADESAAFHPLALVLLHHWAGKGDDLFAEVLDFRDFLMEHLTLEPPSMDASESKNLSFILLMLHVILLLKPSPTPDNALLAAKSAQLRDSKCEHIRSVSAQVVASLIEPEFAVTFIQSLLIALFSGYGINVDELSKNIVGVINEEEDLSSYEEEEKSDDNINDVNDSNEKKVIIDKSEKIQDLEENSNSIKKDDETNKPNIDELLKIETAPNPNRDDGIVLQIQEIASNYPNVMKNLRDNVILLLHKFVEKRQAKFNEIFNIIRIAEIFDSLLEVKQLLDFIMVHSQEIKFIPKGIDAINIAKKQSPIILENSIDFGKIGDSSQQASFISKLKVVNNDAELASLVLQAPHFISSFLPVLPQFIRFAKFIDYTGTGILESLADVFLFYSEELFLQPPSSEMNEEEMEDDEKFFEEDYNDDSEDKKWYQWRLVLRMVSDINNTVREKAIKAVSKALGFDGLNLCEYDVIKAVYKLMRNDKDELDLIKSQIEDIAGEDDELFNEIRSDFLIFPLSFHLQCIKNLLY